MKAIAILAVTLVALPSAAAQPKVRAQLSGYQEVPAVSTVAEGEFLARPSTDLGSVEFTLSYSGLQARVTCVDTSKLPAAWAGRAFDAALLAELPDGVDACGENGEFHTFAHAGPMFARPVPHRVSGRVEAGGFCWAMLA